MKRVSFKVAETSIEFILFIFLCIEVIFAKIFQLPTKEPTSLTSSSRIIDGANLDKKKPFSRPFSKGRLDTGGSVGIGANVRMSSPTPNESNVLLRQNHELRQRLQDESSSYRRRLDTYKQAQSNQSALVSRLQAKVMQYKQRCSELETQMHETTAICPQLDISSSKPLQLPATSTPLSPMCPKLNLLSSSTAPMSLPPQMCTTLDSLPQKPGPIYCSDDSDESFERKRNEEERKL